MKNNITIHHKIIYHWLGFRMQMMHFFHLMLHPKHGIKVYKDIRRNYKLNKEAQRDEARLREEDKTLSNNRRKVGMDKIEILVEREYEVSGGMRADTESDIKEKFCEDLCDKLQESTDDMAYKAGDKVNLLLNESRHDIVLKYATFSFNEPEIDYQGDMKVMIASANVVFDLDRFVDEIVNKSKPKTGSSKNKRYITFEEAKKLWNKCRIGYEYPDGSETLCHDNGWDINDAYMTNKTEQGKFFIVDDSNKKKVQATCISRTRDKSNRIVEYVIKDPAGKIHKIAPAQLKQAIKDKKLDVVNLTLTSDDRLVDAQRQN